MPRALKRRAFPSPQPPAQLCKTSTPTLASNAPTASPAKQCHESGRTSLACARLAHAPAAPHAPMSLPIFTLPATGLTGHGVVGRPRRAARPKLHDALASCHAHTRRGAGGDASELGLRSGGDQPLKKHTLERTRHPRLMACSARAWDWAPMPTTRAKRRPRRNALAKQKDTSLRREAHV